MHGYKSTTAFGHIDTIVAIAFSFGQRNSSKIWFCPTWTTSPTTTGNILCGSVQLLPSSMSSRSRAPRSSSLPTPPGSPINIPFEFQDGVGPIVENEIRSSDDNVIHDTAMDQSVGSDAGFSMVGFGDVMPTALDVSQTDVPAETDLFGGEADLGDWLDRIIERPKEPLLTERLPPVQTQEMPRATSTAEYGVDRCMNSLSPPVPKFFWEEDPFLKTVFCKDDASASAFKEATN